MHGIPEIPEIMGPISIDWCILPGIGLLASFLSFEARKRISAREAMRNPYFDSLGPGVALLKDSECCYLFSFTQTQIISSHFLTGIPLKMRKLSSQILWRCLHSRFPRLESLSFFPLSVCTLSHQGSSNKITPWEVSYSYSPTPQYYIFLLLYFS